MNDKKPVNIFAITTILLLISTIILGLILGKLRSEEHTSELQSQR